MGAVRVVLGLGRLIVEGGMVVLVVSIEWEKGFKALGGVFDSLLVGGGFLVGWYLRMYREFGFSKSFSYFFGFWVCISRMILGDSRDRSAMVVS